MADWKTDLPRNVAVRYRNEEESSSGGIELFGDVTGPSDANTVVALQNYPIPAGDIGSGNVLVSDSSAQWILQPLPSLSAPTFSQTKQQIFVTPTTTPPEMSFLEGAFQINDIVIGLQTQRTVKLAVNMVFDPGFTLLSDATVTWPAGTFPFQIPAYTAGIEAFEGFGWCGNGRVGQAQPMFGIEGFQPTAGGLFLSFGSVPATPEGVLVPPNTQIQYRCVVQYTWLF